MNRRILLTTLLGALLLAEPSLAGTELAKYIRGVQVHEELGAAILLEEPGGTNYCYLQRVFLFLGDNVGRAQFAQALAAKLSGSQVNLEWTVEANGVCKIRSLTVLD